MKQLLAVAFLAIGCSVFGQLTPPTDGETVEDLVPTQEQQNNLQCNSNAVRREITDHGFAISVRCTGASGEFFLYAIPKSQIGNPGPGANPNPSSPGDR